MKKWMISCLVCLLAVVAQAVDTDGDGMDDTWEMDNFQTLEEIADGDYDADGRTNAEELADNTDPANPGSTLGLVAYYPFDGNANDASGNAFHGVWAGGEGYQAGIRGQAGIFDGLDNNITVLNNATLDGLTGEHTLSAWVYINSANNMDIISKDGEYSDRQYILNRTPFNTFQAHVGLVGQRLEIVPGSTEVLARHWCHVIQVHNNGHLTLFVNGQRDNEKIISDYTGPLSGPEPLRIGGGAPKGSQLFFDGLIDEVRIYDRALSSNEVARLYAETAPNPDSDGDGMDDAWEMEMFGNLDQDADGDYDADGRTNAEEEDDGTDPTDAGSTLGLVAYYPFDGNANDATTNGYDGTWGGSESYGAGVREQAASFDGLTDHIDTGDLPEWSTSFAISLWFNPDEQESSIPKTLFSDYEAVAYGRCVYIDIKDQSPAGDELRFVNRAPNSGSEAPAFVLVKSSENLTGAGNWRLLTVVRDNDTAILYLDGHEIMRENDPSAGTFNVAASARIGAAVDYLVQNSHYKGLLDDVRIYSRALSSNEVAALYAATAPTPDTDADGMDDAWEEQHFGNLGQTADGDYDADGRTNAEELADNTDPANPGSTLGLVAYYPFDGNADDATTNGNDGVINGVELISDRFGNQRNAYSFDGVDDYIDIGNPTSNNPMQLTQCAWIYVASDKGGVIMTKRHYDDGCDWPTLLTVKNNNIYASTGSDDINYRSSIFGTTHVYDGEWHLLCSVRDGSIYRIYTDGMLEGEITDGHISGGSPYNFHIGHHGAWNSFFHGAIDDVRIYDRSLSSNEVARLYVKTGGTTPPATLSPDLSASDLRILNSSGAETANPATGDTVTLEVTVRNTGETNTSDHVLVQIFEGSGPRDLSSYNSNEVASVVSGVITESIPVGGAAVVLIPWMVTGSDRMATLTAVAEFESNRTASQAGSALPIEEESLDNNRVGLSVQIGSPFGDYGIDVMLRIPAVITEGQSFTLSGTASYDWGVNEPVLGALATIEVNGVTYTDRTASPDGAWSVLVNGLPAGNYVAAIEVDDGRLVGQANPTLTVSPGPQTVDLRVKEIRFQSGTYRPDAGQSGETGYAITGSNVVLKALVRNDGNTASGDFTVGFRDPSDASYTSHTTNLPAFSEAWITAPAGWAAQAGSQSLTVSADSGNAVSESNEGNNTRSCTVIGSEAKPDLIVTDIAWSPSSPKEGDSVTITATVKNQGGAVLPAGSSFDTAFSLGGTVSTTLASDLPSGSSIPVQTTWTAVAGSHSISAEADSGSAIDEDFENNNSRTETIGVRQALPDLRPYYYLYGREVSWYYRSGLSFSPSKPVAGEAVTVSCDLYNNGTVPLSVGTLFSVEFSTNGTVFATETVTLLSDLAVGAKVPVSTVWNSTDAATVSFSAVVDTLDQVTEEHESNNTTSSSLKVYPAEADLSVTGLGFSPNQPLPGGAVTLTATIRNNGGAAGGPGETVSFFAGTTNNLIGSTNLVADVAAKGGTGTVALDWTAPVTSGSYAVIAGFNGSFFTNTLVVTENPAPNLQVFSEDISVSPALPDSGESVTVTAYIRNTEGSAATNFRVAFYYDRDPGTPPVVLDTVAVDLLAVGSNTTVAAAKPITAENSAYSLRVEIQPNGSQGDADEGDNIATSSFLLADTPNADAGADAVCFVGQMVVFDGSGSANASNYLWEVVSAPVGSAAALVNAGSAAPSFVPDQPGSYVLRLIVGNGTISSTPDTVELTAEWIQWVVESAHGSPIPDIGTNLVEYGAIVTNSVEAAVTSGGTQYISTGWNGVPPEGGTTNRFVATATNHETVVWTWATNYWLETVTSGEGQAAGGNEWVTAGSNVVLSATPDDGWRFDRWLVDGETNALRQIDVVMDSAKTVTCVFVELTLAEAVDNHDLTWTTGGASNWFGQIAETSDGEDAARSGEIGDAEGSWIQTTVPCSGTLSFRWKVASEERYDWLWFEVDGAIWRVISGETDWQQVNLTVDGDGSHTLRWEYAKDKTLSDGEDCGWVDRIVWTPDLEGFALWANERGLSGDAAALFGQDRNGDGIANGFEYAFGTNLPNGLRISITTVNGRPVVEIPMRDDASIPYVDVAVKGSTNLVDWTLTVSPTNGAPAGCEWHKPENTPDKAFFKLEAELR